MYIVILGRQPELGIAELEIKFGAKYINVYSKISTVVDSKSINIDLLGGALKIGKVIEEYNTINWSEVSQKVINLYSNKLSSSDHKITLGISAYGYDIEPRNVQKIGITIKRNLKNNNASVRLVPNNEASLNTAVSHHNKLGLSPNKIEVILVRGKDSTILAESIGAQNITAYSKRDQKRPKRDAFVGMLPPKLAQIMINLVVGNQDNNDEITTEKSYTILDPFCGTGVILQEAALLGYRVYGTDLSEKMIRYSRDNLNWLTDSHHVDFDWILHEGDALNTKWQHPIDAVVSETYLGQPFSAPPSNAKLEEVVKNCDHIISQFLINLAKQIDTGTPICIAVPAWRDKNGSFTHLPLISKIARLGYKPHEFTNVSRNSLIYCRDTQTVARELLVLRRL